ncbi:MAG: cobalt ECF transporter T component CbiQ [Desulfobacteraceae bacterium]|nr:cobalt ECF transporter T component CbiQ [Desulfobacteraceae bacterium]
MIEEDFPNGNSVIDHLDPRVKMVVAGAFSLVVATADRFLALVPAMVLSLSFMLLAGLRLNKVCFRLLIVNGLILLLWIFLPFTVEGEPLFTLGSLTATKEGIIYSTLITIKSNSIVVAIMALLATMPVVTMGRAMRELYVPEKMVHLFFFTNRYIHTIHMEYNRQMNAIKIRGFRPGTNVHTYRTYAYLVGMLLVKSHYRAERVRAAMLCRGFRGKFYDLREFSFTSSDLIIMIVMLLAVTSVGLLQWTNIFSSIISNIIY